MPQIGPLEIAVVLLVALLAFGPKRLPELARQVGGALRELRRIQHSVTSELRDLMTDESAGAAPAPTLAPLAPGATVDPEAVRAAGGVVPEPDAEPDPDPVTDAAAHPAADPVADPAADPAGDPGADPDTAPPAAG